MSILARIGLMIGCIVLCQAAGALGALGTESGSSPWYQALRKPSFNPPGWVFGPVWITLYTMMGVCLYMLLRHWPASRLALLLFAVQLVLNATWTPVFFGAHAVGSALVVIMLMWLAILGTILAVWPISRLAGTLLIPYLLWVSFATILNYAIWRLNS